MEAKYFETVCKKRILQINPLTETYTDLAKHAKRVLQFYKQNGCKTKNILLKSKLGFLNSLKIFNSILFSFPNIVDYHLALENANNSELFTLILLRSVFRYKLNLIFHDTQVTKLSFFKKIILNSLLKFTPNTYFLTDSILKLYKNKDIKVLDAKINSIYVSEDIVKKDFKKFNGLEKFLEKHNPLISACCPELAINNKNDEYGIDLTIEIIRKLKQANKCAGAIIVINKILDPQYYNYLELLVQAYGLQESIYFLVGYSTAIDIIEKSNIFLVLNSIKNQYINILDALNNNIKTIVNESNATKINNLQIKDCISFKNNDIENLYLTISNIAKSEDEVAPAAKRGRPRKVIALDI